MHVVITGGLGFIGSSIAKRLCRDGHAVSLIDNFATSTTKAVDGANVVQLDLMDADATDAVDLPDAHCMMHLAGPSSGMEAHADPVKTISEGYQVTLNTLGLAKRLKVSRVLNASSMVLYGLTAPNPVTETESCLPVSHYGVGKLANERLVEIFCKEHAIGFNQMRFFNVYGPGQDLTRMGQGLVSIFLAMLVKSPKVTMKGSPKRFRDVVHIDDVADVCIKCAASEIEDGPLNVGSGEAIVYEDLIKLIADELGVLDDLEIEEQEGTPGDLFGIYADITKIKSALGFEPQYPPEKGVRQFTRWVTSQPTDQSTQ